MFSRWFYCLLLIVWCGVAQAAPIAIETIQRTEPVSFERDILPILQRNCLACHSASQKDGELVLESPRSILAGGDSGPAAVAGNGTESLILKVASHQVADKVMPPAGNDVQAQNLTPQELGLLKLWIDQGAQGTGGVDALSPQKWHPLPRGINPVQAISLTDDGQLIAASRANQIFLYHGPTGSLITRLTDPLLKTFLPANVPGGKPVEVQGIAHRDLVQSLAFNVDGDLLASGSFREVKLWRRPRDVMRWSVALGGKGTSVAISPDRQWVAIANDLKEIRLFQATDGQTGPILTGHSDQITGLRFGRDSRTLYSSSLDQTVRLWNVISGKSVASVLTPAPVQSLELVDTAAPTEQLPQPPQWLVTGHADSQIRVWRIAGRSPLVTPLSFEERSAISPDGQLLAVSDSTGLVRIVSLQPGAQQQRELVSWRIEGGLTALALLQPAIPTHPAPESPIQGHMLATGTPDGMIRVWSLPQHEIVQEWRGDSGIVTALAGNRSGKVLASGLSTGVVTQWDLKGVSAPIAPEASPILDTAAPITLTALSPSRKLLAYTGSHQGQLAIFVRNLETRQLIATLLGHTAKIRTLSFSPSETSLASGGEDQTIRLWNLQNPAQPLAPSIENLPAAVTALAWNPEGTHVLAGFSDHGVRLYNPQRTKPEELVVREFAAHAGPILYAGYLQGQPYTVAGDKLVRFLNPADGTQTRAINLPAATTAISLSSDGTRLAVAGDDKLVRVLQLDNGQILQTLPALLQPASAVSFSADSQRLAVLAGGGELSVWHLPTLKLQEAARDPGLSTVLFASDTLGLFTGHQQGQIAAHPLRYQRHFEGNTQPITDLAYHPSGATLYLTAADGAFKGYDTQTGQPTFATTHGAAIHDLAVSTDGNLLATAGENMTVRLWTAAGAPAGPQQLTGFASPVTRVGFSADGARVFASSSGEKGFVGQYDFTSGLLLEKFATGTSAALDFVARPPVPGTDASQPASAIWLVAANGLYDWDTAWVRTISGHSGPVATLTRVPSNPRQVLSGSSDGTVRRWNLDNGQTIQQFNHGGPVLSVSVDPKVERVASASDNHTIRLFRMDGQVIADLRGDIRRRVAQTRAQQQLDAATARLNLVKQLAQQAEQDLPLKTTAEQTLTTSLNTANQDVVTKQAAFDKAKADKAAAETAALQASTNSKTALVAKEQAEVAAKDAVVAMQTAQAKMQRLQQSAAADAKNEELKKLVAAAMQELATCQQNSQTATAAVAVPTQTAQQMATLANEAAQKVTQLQKPYTDAAAALKASQMAQNLLSQQQALAAKELKQATDLIPLRKDAVTRAEAAQVAQQQALTAAQTSTNESDLPIRSVEFSADGSTLLSSGDFSNAHLWDGLTGGGIGAFAGHTAKVAAAVFVDTGSLISISDDQTARCWDVSPGWKLERVIGSIDDPNQIIHRVNAVDFSSDSTQLLIAGGVPSRTGELSIYRVADGVRTLHLPQAHTDTIYAARFSPDNKRIASGGADKYLRTFDVATGQQLRRFEGHTNYVLGLDWKGDGQTIASAGADNVVKVWDAEAGDQKLTIENQFTRHVTALQYLGETDSIVTACGDKLVRMHNASNGGLERNFGEIKTWLHCVASTPDRALVVAGDAQGGVLFWNGQTGQWIRTVGPPVD